MTDWTARVEFADALGQDQAEELTHATPEGVYTTVTVDQERQRTAVSLLIEASTLRQATEAGTRIGRDAAAAVGLRAEMVGLQVRTLDDVDAELRRPALPKLAGIAEIAAILDVSKQRAGELTRTHPDFPRPVDELASGRVYTEDSIRAFEARWERRRTGRPPKVDA